VGKRGREGVDIIVETSAEMQMGEGRGKVKDGLVEIHSKADVGEGEGLLQGLVVVSGVVLHAFQVL